MGELFKINKKEAIERILKVLETQIKSVILIGYCSQDSNELAKRFSDVYETMKDNKDIKIIKNKFLNIWNF